MKKEINWKSIVDTAEYMLQGNDEYDFILIKINPEDANQVNYISDRMVFILDNQIPLSQVVITRARGGISVYPESLKCL